MRGVLLRKTLLVLSALLIAGCTATNPESSSTSSPAPSNRSTSTSAPTTTAEASAASCREKASGPKTLSYANRSGVEPNLTSLDVYLPPGCGPAPVLLSVHGGGWRRGDKSNGMKQKVAWAESLGAALVSVNYRLTTPDSGVQWPDHGQDLAAAVAWVQQNGPAQGLDPTKLTLIGHSAGAHLVAIVATDQALLTTAGADPAKVSCVVALDFSFDLASAPADKMIADAFGTDPQLIAAASPNVQIERNGAPSARFLIATRGGRSRVADAQAFVDLVNTSGGSAELVDATPYTHNQVSTQLGAADDTLVTPAVTEFVQSCN
ncbi:MAG: alpha/beta hydrolase fold domain-containing protein [Actinobacteria bacterium]|nr:alpha/beta hydrolase fold domain-containing protein [Actinomycetota bacterium]